MCVSDPSVSTVTSPLSVYWSLPAGKQKGVFPANGALMSTLI